VSVWDLRAGTSFVLSPASAASKGQTAGAITALAVDPLDRYFALVDDYRTVRLVDRKQGKVFHSRMSRHTPHSQHRDVIIRLRAGDVNLEAGT